jgi:hypothetical protein
MSTASVHCTNGTNSAFILVIPPWDYIRHFLPVTIQFVCADQFQAQDDVPKTIARDSTCRTARQPPSA